MSNHPVLRQLRQRIEVAQRGRASAVAELEAVERANAALTAELVDARHRISDLEVAFDLAAKSRNFNRTALLTVRAHCAANHIERS